MKVRTRRQAKHFALLLGLCLALGLVVNYIAAPHHTDTTGFDLERELELLPEDQRAAARDQWESLSETEQDRARRISSHLSPEARKQALEKLKARAD